LFDRLPRLATNPEVAMTKEERMMEVAKLRLKLRTNSRLRRELKAALSKVFREHEEPIGQGLLSSIVFAVPAELKKEPAPTRLKKGPYKNPPAGPPI
jgi:hypothetical protein